MIVLDSDVLIEIGEKKSEKGYKASERVLQSGEEIFITAITLHEVLYSFHKRGKPADDLLSFSVLDYTQKDAMLSSKVELEAERRGSRISRTDAIIAAIAVNNEGKLCTFNVKHFSSLKTFGLKLFP